MYLINITVKDTISDEEHHTLFEQHSLWFKKHFEAGRFLMLGPYVDTDAKAGVIFARAGSREELDAVLAEDCYYPDLADYQIREFAPKMISQDIVKAKA